jgi:hypothetical protein
VAGRVFPILFLDLVILLGEIEGLAGFLRGDQLVGVLVERIHGIERVGFLQGAEMVVHRFEERAAAVEAFFIDPAREVEVAHLEISLRGIRAEGEGAVGGGEVAGVRVFVGDVGDADVGREVVAGAELVGDDGAHRWKGKRRGGAVAGEHVVGAALVGGLAVRHAADHGDLVGDVCRFLHELAELDAGDLRIDGSERAAVFGGCEGFRIEGFLVGEAAGEEDVDHAFRDGRVFRELLHRRAGAGAEELRQREADRAEQAYVEEFTARGVVFERIAGALRFHGSFRDFG